MYCEGVCAGRQSARDSWARTQPASGMTAIIGRMLTASSTWCAFAIFVYFWSSCLSPLQFHESGHGPANLLATAHSGSWLMLNHLLQRPSLTRGAYCWPFTHRDISAPDVLQMDTALDTYDSDPEQQEPADAARPSIAAASADPSLDASDLNSSGSGRALAPSAAGAECSQA